MASLKENPERQHARASAVRQPAHQANRQTGPKRARRGSEAPPTAPHWMAMQPQNHGPARPPRATTHTPWPTGSGAAPPPRWRDRSDATWPATRAPARHAARRVHSRVAHGTDRYPVRDVAARRQCSPVAQPGAIFHAPIPGAAHTSSYTRDHDRRWLGHAATRCAPESPRPCPPAAPASLAVGRQSDG